MRLAYVQEYIPTYTALHSPLCSTQLGLCTATLPQPGHPTATLCCSVIFWEVF